MCLWPLSSLVQAMGRGCEAIALIPMQSHWVMGENNNTPDSKVHGANMGSTWVLSAPYGPRVGPMTLPIRDNIRGLNVFFLRFTALVLRESANEKYY